MLELFHGYTNSIEVPEELRDSPAVQRYRTEPNFGYPVQRALFLAPALAARREIGLREEPELTEVFTSHIQPILAYLFWLRHQFRERYGSDFGAWLPSEGHWLRAQRGDDGRLYPWGNDFAGGGFLIQSDGFAFTRQAFDPDSDDLNVYHGDIESPFGVRATYHPIALSRFPQHFEDPAWHYWRPAEIVAATTPSIRDGEQDPDTDDVTLSWEGNTDPNFIAFGSPLTAALGQDGVPDFQRQRILSVGLTNSVYCMDAPILLSFMRTMTYPMGFKFRLVVKATPALRVAFADGRLERTDDSLGENRMRWTFDGP